MIGPIITAITIFTKSPGIKGMTPAPKAAVKLIDA